MKLLAKCLTKAILAAAWVLGFWYCVSSAPAADLKIPKLHRMSAAPVEPPVRFDEGRSFDQPADTHSDRYRGCLLKYHSPQICKGVL